jgi:hypothetical protein
MTFNATHRLVLCAATSFAAAGAALADAKAPFDHSRTPEAQLALLGHLRASHVEFPVLPEDNAIPEQFTTTVTIDGQPLVINLERSSVRSELFQIVLKDDNGETILHAGPERTYRGDVQSIPGSRVAAYLYDSTRIGMAIFIGEQKWQVQPIDALQPGSHVVYRPEDLMGGRVGRCGVADRIPGAVPAVPAFSPRGPGSTTRVVILCDSDYEFWDSFGGAGGVTSEIQSIINEVNSSYSDKGICFAIGKLQLRGGPNANFTTSTDKDVLLNAFKAEWESAAANADTSNFHNVAHLFTYRDIDGSTVGYGSVGAMVCTNAPIPTRNNAYSFSSTVSFWNGELYPHAHRVEVCAHELGHNWGLEHCDQPASGCGQSSSCGIMTSSFDPTAPGRTAFSGCSHNQLLGLRAAYAGCGTECGASTNAVCLGICTYTSIGQAAASAPIGSFLPVYPRPWGSTTNWPENIVLSRPMTFTAASGPVKIGQ